MRSSRDSVAISELDLGGDHDRDRAFFLGALEDFSREIVAVPGRGLLDIADIEYGLCGHQPEHAEGALLFELALDEARRSPLAQQHQRAIDEVELLLRLLVVALGFFRQIVDALLQTFEVGEHQLGLDGLDVGERRDLALDMGDVAILEAAHDMRDRVDLADVGEELVAEALALRGAAHQAGDVDEGQPRRNDLRRFRDAGERVEPRIGNGDLADIRLDGAERIVGRLRRRRFRQRIEQRRLADIGQPDDTAFESHLIFQPSRSDRALF